MQKFSVTIYGISETELKEKKFRENLEKMLNDLGFGHYDIKISGYQEIGK